MASYRIYFNRELEWPQCWSVDEGDQSTEINVVGFIIHGGKVHSRTLSKKERTDAIRDRLNRPFAWMEVHDVEMELVKGVAQFSGE